LQKKKRSLFTKIRLNKKKLNLIRSIMRIKGEGSIHRNMKIYFWILMTDFKWIKINSTPQRKINSKTKTFKRQISIITWSLNTKHSLQLLNMNSIILGQTRNVALNLICTTKSSQEYPKTLHLPKIWIIWSQIIARTVYLRLKQKLEKIKKWN